MIHNLEYTFFPSFSSCGYLGLINGKEPESGQLRAKFESSESILTQEQLSQMMNDFVAAAEAGNHSEQVLQCCFVAYAENLTFN